MAEEKFDQRLLDLIRFYGKEWYTQSEIAKKLNRNPNTISRYVRKIREEEKLRRWKYE